MEEDILLEIISQELLKHEQEKEKVELQIIDEKDKTRLQEGKNDIAGLNAAIESYKKDRVDIINMSEKKKDTVNEIEIAQNDYNKIIAQNQKLLQEQSEYKKEIEKSQGRLVIGPDGKMTKSNEQKEYENDLEKINQELAEFSTKISNAKNKIYSAQERVKNAENYTDKMLSKYHITRQQVQVKWAQEEYGLVGLNDNRAVHNRIIKVIAEANNLGRLNPNPENLKKLEALKQVVPQIDELAKVYTQLRNGKLLDTLYEDINFDELSYNELLEKAKSIIEMIEKPLQPKVPVETIQPEAPAEPIQTEVPVETIQPEAPAEPIQAEASAEPTQPKAQEGQAGSPTSIGINQGSRNAEMNGFEVRPIPIQMPIKNNEDAKKTHQTKYYANIAIYGRKLSIKLGNTEKEYEYLYDDNKIKQMIKEELQSSLITGRLFFNQEEIKNIEDSVGINDLIGKKADLNIVYALIKTEKSKTDLMKLDDKDTIKDLKSRINSAITKYADTMKPADNKSFEASFSKPILIKYDCKDKANLEDSEYAKLKENAYNAKSYAKVNANWYTRVSWKFRDIMNKYFNKTKTITAPIVDQTAYNKAKEEREKFIEEMNGKPKDIGETERCVQGYMMGKDKYPKITKQKDNNQER